jgi:uncharacterized protein (TIGR04255 family)
MQPVNPVSVQIVVGDVRQIEPQPQPPSRPVPTFRFATSTGDRFVQVSDVSFVYQATAPYPGWSAIKAIILDLWGTVRPAIQPDAVIKIGLRYINRIAKDETHRHVGDWLCASDYIPAALTRSRQHFLARLETSPADEDQLLVTLANQPPMEAAPQGSIIFDIDRVRTGSVGTDSKGIGEVLEILHEDIWSVFWSSRTPVLEEKLKRSQ